MYTESFFKQRLDDENAVYLEKGNYGIVGDGVADDTMALQNAIYDMKRKLSFGIVYLPEGKYLISDTIFIPKAIRLIGYGENRPQIILKDNAKGFDKEYPKDKGKSKYMIWFTGGIPKSETEIEDANPGTFYSALSNVDIIIGKNNPHAVAIRSHFAQHSFISHCMIDATNGRAGIYDIGNEMEDVTFIGGDYGIDTTKPSPGWPFMMVDCNFIGQRKAAIKSREGGLTIVRMTAKDTPKVIESTVGYIEKLYMEDSSFYNISDCVLYIRLENNTLNQWNLRNVFCENAPILAKFDESKKEVLAPGEIYCVNSFVHGVQIDNLGAEPEIKTTFDLKKLDRIPDPIKTDIPAFPDIKTWVNLKDLGAKGDAKTDDTKVLKEAIEKYDTIYVPMGWYIITDTIKLKENTNIIGLNPVAVQFILPDNTEIFGMVGKPKAFFETPVNGKNIISGIGIDSGARNPRAVGLKWQSGENSYLNDVKFIGGHGSMQWGAKGGVDWIPSYNDTGSADYIPERKWDGQYWSLWITNGGGGVFKDIWTASTFSCSGCFISDTSTRGRIYAMSVEHHVRNEVELKNVSNFKILALQTEEERTESQQCQPLELTGCSDIVFANLYTFRVIWLPNPYPYVIKSWNNKNIEFLNVHNYTQVKYTINNTLIDYNSGVEVRPWQIARFYMGEEPVKADKKQSLFANGEVQKICGGFDFVDGTCSDSKGNVYFCDSHYMRIFKIDAETQKVTLVRDVPYRPLSLGCDTEDNLIVAVEFIPPKGATLNGEPIPNPDKGIDAPGTSYGGWYFPEARVILYSIDPENPEESMILLEKVSREEIKNPVKVLYPANRWRDNNDYLVATIRKQKEFFVAQDGVTVIPAFYDLIRSNSLLEAYPGKKFYAVDEYLKRIVSYDVDDMGEISNPEVFAEKGEYSAISDKDHVYVADCEVFIYDKEGNIIDEIKVPERPATICFGGKDKKTLYIAARTSMYKVDLKR